MRWHWTGDKQTCRVRTSNAGHCLVHRHRVPRARLACGRGRSLGAEILSGWGVRTLASFEHHYDPLGPSHRRHLGLTTMVLIAQGLENATAWPGERCCGFRRRALQRCRHALRASLHIAGAVLRLSTRIRPLGSDAASDGLRSAGVVGGLRVPSICRRAWVWRSTAPRRASASPSLSCLPRWQSCESTTCKLPEQGSICCSSAMSTASPSTCSGATARFRSWSSDDSALARGWNSHKHPEHRHWGALPLSAAFLLRRSLPRVANDPSTAHDQSPLCSRVPFSTHCSAQWLASGYSREIGLRDCFRPLACAVLSHEA